jgi:predicted N-acetyltransferase YhbS
MMSVARPAASPADVLAGIAVRQEAYRRKTPLAVTQARRLGSRREHRAVPWVLDRGDGTIVSTLVVHPIELALDDRTYPAYGIGSVGTLDAERRKGHAARLVRAASEANEARGRPVGLLFASIAPKSYERLGFHVAPAHGFTTSRLQALADGGEAARLVPVDPRREVERLAAMWRAAHAGRLHPHRDAARFLESVEDAADDWFFEVEGARGYVRLHAEAAEPELDLVETALPDPAHEGPVLRAVARLALDFGSKALGGWLEPSEFVREWFEPGSRTMNLPMLRGAPPHASSRFWPSDHF